MKWLNNFFFGETPTLSDALWFYGTYILTTTISLAVLWQVL